MRAGRAIIAILTGLAQLGSGPPPAAHDLLPAAARSSDSNAGLTGDGLENYQRVVDYDLSVRYSAGDKKLFGEGKVTWQNRTPFAVRELWWHLYLNAFRNDRSTLMKESQGGRLRKDVFKDEKWGWIELTKLESRGADLLEERVFEHPDDDNLEDRTVMRTPLPREVPPGGSIEIQMSFEAQLPRVFARSGYGGTFSMVAQWFPKIGVLEVADDPAGGRAKKIARWNCHQYHATSEFFADYGHFKVAINVPHGFEVGATGKRVQTLDEGGTATYVYEQDRVHDFAWTVDPRFLRKERVFVAAKEVTPEETAEAAKLLGLEPKDLALGDVNVTLLLQPEHARFEDRYFRSAFAAIKWFGLWYGAYPYETLTVVDGPRLATGAMGMEYPTLITGGVRWPAPEDVASPEGVTIHEFGHQYWYALVGSNEFEESWLDEGFNTYSTGKVIDRAYPPFALVLAPDFPLTPWPNVRPTRADIDRIGTLASPTTDAIARPAWMYRNTLSYGVNSYPRTGLTLRQLELDVGPRTFARAMRLYHLRYRYRHPKGSDFIAAVEEVAGRPLTEFFERSVYSPGALDYGITELTSEPLGAPAGYLDDRKLVTRKEAKAIDREKKNAGERSYLTTVYVERIGEVVRPVVLEITFEDGSTKRETWDGNYRWTRFKYTTPSKAATARLWPDGEVVLDLARANDTRKPNSDTRPGVSWGGRAIYIVETLLQIAGAIL